MKYVKYDSKGREWQLADSGNEHPVILPTGGKTTITAACAEHGGRQFFIAYLQPPISGALITDRCEWIGLDKTGAILARTSKMDERTPESEILSLLDTPNPPRVEPTAPPAAMVEPRELVRQILKGDRRLPGLLKIHEQNQKDWTWLASLDSRSRNTQSTAADLLARFEADPTEENAAPFVTAICNADKTREAFFALYQKAKAGIHRRISERSAATITALLTTARAGVQERIDHAIELQSQAARIAGCSMEQIPSAKRRELESVLEDIDSRMENADNATQIDAIIELLTAP